MTLSGAKLTSAAGSVVQTGEPKVTMWENKKTGEVFYHRSYASLDDLVAALESKRVSLHGYDNSKLIKDKTNMEAGYVLKDANGIVSSFSWATKNNNWNVYERKNRYNKGSTTTYTMDLTSPSNPNYAKEIGTMDDLAVYAKLCAYFAKVRVYMM